MKRNKIAFGIACVALLMLASGELKAAGTVPQGWQKGPSGAWFVNWDAAMAEAKKTNRPIFVLKTGSDWCGWCRKLRQDVFEKDEFKDYARKNLVLLYLDGPRKPLPADQKLHNDTICGVLGFGGGVPCAAVFSVDARRFGTISGYSKTPTEYIARIDKVLAREGELPKNGVPPEIFTKGYVAPATAVAQTEDAEEAPAPEYRSEKVDGVTWRYFISNGMAVLEAPYKEKRPDSQMRFRWSVIDSKTAGAVKIPEKLGGVAVGRIGEEAFSCCTNLVSITIPNGVVSIGGAAFYACKALKSITIPSSVKSVAQKAFAKCYRLEEVVIKPGLESIGWQAFIGCPRLSYVRLPSSVRVIDTRKRGAPFSVFEPMYPKNASSLGMPPLCDELTFVVDKGDEGRVRGMFFDKRFERRQELVKKRGSPDRAIKVMTEDEYRHMKDWPSM